MARGRFISESVATDARLNSLSVEAELVYLMAIPHLDRDGLIEGDPNVLWGKVCPKRRQFLDTMAVYIQEWAKAGLVLMYDSDNGPVLWFKGFVKNQLGLRYDRETPSKFPPPPQNEVRQTSGKLPDNDGGSSAQWQAQSEVKDQVEVKAQAARAQESPTPPPPTAPAATQDDALSPKALIADLHSRHFVYMDKDATVIAAKLIADYGWPRVMEAADTAEARHKEKINSGSGGITAPLAYMRSILAGTASGNQQARGYPPTPIQSMGETSVDKFLARYNGVKH